MNCNNIIYIAQNYISFIYKNQLIRIDFPKEVLKNGIIIDKENFMKIYLSFYKKNRLSKKFWSIYLTVIHNSMYHENDISMLYEIFHDLGYNNIKLVCDKTVIPLNKKVNYLINGDIIRLLYIDKYNSKKELFISKSDFENYEIKLLIRNRCNNKQLYILGDQDLKYIPEDIEYYIFPKQDEYFLKN